MCVVCVCVVCGFFATMSWAGRGRLPAVEAAGVDWFPGILPTPTLWLGPWWSGRAALARRDPKIRGGRTFLHFLVRGAFCVCVCVCDFTIMWRRSSVRLALPLPHFTTFGGFGEGTHELIKKITNDTDWNCNDPWVKPSPNSRAYLTFGFALARANARMLLHADSRRRSAKNRVRTTRPRSTTP